MCAQGLDGAFSRIGAVDVERNELEGSIPVLGNVGTACLAGFVVENLVFDNVAFVAEVGHDAGMSSNAVAVMARLEGFDKDGLAVTVVGQHDVLVATMGAGGEESHVVRVEFADGLDGDLQFMGGGQWSGRRGAGGRGPGLGFGGADALSGLGEMTFDGVGAVRAVFCSISMGEYGPAGVVAGFDSGKPGGLDREACSSM